MTKEIAFLIASSTNIGKMKMVEGYEPAELLAPPTCGIVCPSLGHWSHGLASAVANLSHQDTAGVNFNAGKVVAAMGKLDFAKFGSGIIIY